MSETFEASPAQKALLERLERGPTRLARFGGGHRALKTAYMTVAVLEKLSEGKKVLVCCATEEHKSELLRLWPEVYGHENIGWSIPVSEP